MNLYPPVPGTEWGQKLLSPPDGPQLLNAYESLLGGGSLMIWQASSRVISERVPELRKMSYFYIPKWRLNWKTRRCKHTTF